MQNNEITSEIGELINASNIAIQQMNPLNESEKITMKLWGNSLKTN